MEDWTDLAISIANVTVKHTIAGFHELQIPQLQFGYKLGSEGFLSSYKYGFVHHIKPFVPVITRTTGLQYVTCYRERYRTFEIYIAPFQPELWLSLLTTLLLVIALASIYKYFTNTSFCAWMFILATLFEETGHVPQKLNKISISV